MVLVRVDPRSLGALPHVLPRRASFHARLRFLQGFAVGCALGVVLYLRLDVRVRCQFCDIVNLLKCGILVGIQEANLALLYQLQVLEPILSHLDQIGLHALLYYHFGEATGLLLLIAVSDINVILLPLDLEREQHYLNVLDEAEPLEEVHALQVEVCFYFVQIGIF